MNRIGWCTDTINPITGCLNGCIYCYARKFAKRHAGRFGYPKDDPFRPTFHFDKLAKLTGLKGKGKRVFLDSMGDWFSEGVNREWVWACIESIRHLPDHHFMVLTKRPDKMNEILGQMIGPMPGNLWFGVSLTCQEDVWRVSKLINSAYSIHIFVSIEPLYGPIECDFSGVEWVIIGAESGNRKGKIVPEKQWIKDLSDAAKNIPVFMKSNLRYAIQCADRWEWRQEFPKEMV